jgi:hypothetical protein
MPVGTVYVQGNDNEDGSVMKNSRCRLALVACGCQWLVRCWHHDVIAVTKNMLQSHSFGRNPRCSSSKASHMSQFLELVEHHSVIPPSRQPDNLSQVPTSRMIPPWSELGLSLNINWYSALRLANAYPHLFPDLDLVFVVVVAIAVFHNAHFPWSYPPVPQSGEQRKAH